MRKYLWVVVPFVLTLIFICTCKPVTVTYYTPTVEFLPPLPQHVKEAIDPELVGVQVPIPKSMRVYNESNNQCVWCTLESLGMFNKSKGTAGLTTQYKYSTGPKEVAMVLDRRHARFIQIVTPEDKDSAYNFLEEWVTKKKMGCGIALYPNCTHMVTIIDFRRGKSVKIIDNADPDLKIQTWSWEKFTTDFYGWVIVVLPDSE